MKFKGKAAFLLGGSCKIALETAKVLIDNNIKPILSYRNASSKNHIINYLEDFSEDYLLYELNLTSSKEKKIQIDVEIDYLLDFAHSDYEALIASSDENQIEQYFHVNLINKAKLIKNICREMLRKKFGRFVYISSTASDYPNPGQGFYASSKLALEALYKNIGVELGGKGITSVTIKPGYIKAGRGLDYISNLSQKIPEHYLIEATSIANTILFLLSDTSLAINATSLTVDGGMSQSRKHFS